MGNVIKTRRYNLDDEYLKNKYDITLDELKKIKSINKYVVGSNNSNKYTEGYRNYPYGNRFALNITDVIDGPKIYKIKASGNIKCEYGMCEADHVEIVEEIKRENITGIFEHCGCEFIGSIDDGWGCIDQYFIKGRRVKGDDKKFFGCE
jgi:hypothetical protein